MRKYHAEVRVFILPPSIIAVVIPDQRPIEGLNCFLDFSHVSASMSH